MSHFISAGTGEVMQYLVHDYNDNTIRFLLRYEGFLDAEALCAALSIKNGSRRAEQIYENLLGRAVRSEHHRHLRP